MCSTAVRDPLAEMDISDVRAMFYEESEVSLRDKAEMAFAIAWHCHRTGNIYGVRMWANRSIDLFRRTDTNSESKCAPVHPVIAGTPLPSLIHGEGVRHHVERYWGISLDDA